MQKTVIDSRMLCWWGRSITLASLDRKQTPASLGLGVEWETTSQQFVHYLRVKTYPHLA